MADVFLSYSRKDSAIADRFSSSMEREGTTCFYDISIDVGEPWDERIENEIASAGAVVVLWSSRSCDSRWVKLEARYGLQREALCPALVSDCTIPLEFSGVQSANLIGWEGDRSHGEWKKLIAAVSVLCHGNAADDPATLSPDQEKAFITILLASAAQASGSFELTENILIHLRRSRAFREMDDKEAQQLVSSSWKALKDGVFYEVVRESATLFPARYGRTVFAHAASIAMGQDVVISPEIEFLRKLAADLHVDEPSLRATLHLIQGRNTF